MPLKQRKPKYLNLQFALLANIEYYEEFARVGIAQLKIPGDGKCADTGASREPEGLLGREQLGESNIL